MRSPRVAVLGVFLLIAALAGTVASGSTVFVQGGTITDAGDTISCVVTLDTAPDGLLGYRMNMTLKPSGIAEFEGVQFPEWAGFLNSSLPVSPTDLYLKAADLGQVQPGAEDTLLATLTIRGIANGTATLSIDNLDLQDENGDWVECTIQPGSIVVGSVPGTDETTPPTTIPTTVITTIVTETQPLPPTSPITIEPTTSPVSPYLPQGNIYLTSSPSGASVNLDGQPKGETPVLLSAVAGQHSISVSADGYYTYTGTVTFNAGALGVRSIKLQSPTDGPPPTSPTPTETVTSVVTTQQTMSVPTTGGFSWPVFTWPEIKLPSLKPPWPFNWI